MITDEQKSWGRSVLGPLTSFFGSLGIHPNVLTVVGLIFAIAAGRALWLDHYRMGALLLLVGGVFDMLDGEVARAEERGSRFGAFFDSAIDRYTEIIPYLGLAYAMRLENLFLLPYLVITGSLMVSYTRARMEGLGGTCTVGLLERPERIALLFLGLMLGGFFLLLALVLLAAGSHFTAFQRMRQARSVL